MTALDGTVTAIVALLDFVYVLPGRFPGLNLETFAAAAGRGRRGRSGLFVVEEVRE